jgi:hypothetical protein
MVIKLNTKSQKSTNMQSISTLKRATNIRSTKKQDKEDSLL